MIRYTGERPPPTVVAHVGQLISYKVKKIVSMLFFNIIFIFKFVKVVLIFGFCFETCKSCIIFLSLLMIK